MRREKTRFADKSPGAYIVPLYPVPARVARCGLVASATFSGGLAVESVSAASGGLALVAAVVVGGCVLLTLLGGPIESSGGLPVAA